MVSKSESILVFIDPGLEHYQDLAKGAVEGVEVTVLDPQCDGIQQITAALRSRQNVKTVHVLSHGAPGVLALGNTRLTPATLSHYLQNLQSWSTSLAKNAEILLYGCRLAADAAGRSLIQQIAQLTEASVAASETLTGSAALGGDWNLAIRTAAMKAVPALRADVMQAYSAVMPIFDWSDPDIEWPGGTIGTNIFENVDGTDVDFIIDISTTNGVSFGPPGDPSTPDDVAFLQGGQDDPEDSLHITMDNEDIDDAVTTTVSFGLGADNVSFEIYDIDENFVEEGWQDEVVVIGFRGNTVVLPTLTPSDDATYTLDGNIATGQGNSPNTGAGSDAGTLLVEFDSTITSYQVIYRNGPDADNNPGEQGISILSNIFFQAPEDIFPDTDNARLRVAPGNTEQVSGLGGSDSDGTVERFRITSLPGGRQGTLFLGAPDDDNEISRGDRIRANRINDIFFQASNRFSGDTFEYAAIDDDGLEDPTPGVVRLRPQRDPNEPNQPPDTDDVTNRVEPNSVRRLRGLGGSDPDGTVEQFRIETLPRQGTLFLGNPNRNNAVRVARKQIIDAVDISNLFFESKRRFSSTSFDYAAIDNQGARDRTPATVQLLAPDSNALPETTPFSTVVPPNSVRRLRGFAVSDPDGDDTVETFTILSLPPKRYGELFVGNPQQGGTPVSKGEPIDIAQLDQIFISSTEDFEVGVDDNGEPIPLAFRFFYTATDDQGGTDPTPARVRVDATGQVITPGCLPGDRIRGTEQDDRLSGGINNDTLLGGGGNDQLRGRGCDDLIEGDEGDDLLLGQTGNDILDGGDGNDVLDGGGGQDILLGKDGNDRINGGRGDDRARGGKGRDRISGDTGDDELSGKGDDDDISGDDGNDTILGGRGEDRLKGGNGDDNIQGRSGNDRIRGDRGADRLQGNRGDDTISGRIGQDRINGGLGDDVLSGDAGRDRIRGENGDDRISGGSGSDRIRGNAGDDRLRGNKGSDIVNGGKDNDFLSGRNGEDRLRGASGDDQARGNKGNDTLIGNRGNDRLNGRQGNDIIIGGFGEDILTGGRGEDIFVYRTIRDGGDTGDAIRNFSVRQDRFDLSQLFEGRQFSENGRFVRYVSLSQSGAATLLDINVAGDDGEEFRPFAVIRGVQAATVDRSNFILG